MAFCAMEKTQQGRVWGHQAGRDAKALCMWEHHGDPASRSEIAKGVRDQRVDGEAGRMAGTSWGIVRTLALTLRSTGSPWRVPSRGRKWPTFAHSPWLLCWHWTAGMDDSDQGAGGRPQHGELMAGMRCGGVGEREGLKGCPGLGRWPREGWRWRWQCHRWAWCGQRRSWDLRCLHSMGGRQAAPFLKHSAHPTHPQRPHPPCWPTLCSSRPSPEPAPCSPGTLNIPLILTPPPAEKTQLQGQQTSSGKGQVAAPQSLVGYGLGHSCSALPLSAPTAGVARPQ